MSNINKIIVTKGFLEKVLVEPVTIGYSLSRLIDNSIEAKKDTISKEEPCNIVINIFQEFISIADNSGGVNCNLTEKDIFKMGDTGLGMKKTLLELGNRIDLLSNKKGFSRRFSLALDKDLDELVCDSEEIQYNDKISDGTLIFISELNGDIKKRLLLEKSITEISKTLGEKFKNYIEENLLKILVNGNVVRNETFNDEKVISIQYKVSARKVEELKEYYNDKSAKDIGIRAFNKLYEEYKKIF